MLILTRRAGEALRIGDDIEVTVMAVNGTQVRIGIKDDARHQGGINLFGRRFGNYPQDLVMRIAYEFPPEATRAPAK